MKFCHECGKKLPDRSKFCTACGTLMPTDDAVNSKSVEDITVQAVIAEQIIPDTEAAEQIEPTEKNLSKKRKTVLRIIIPIISLLLVAAMVAAGWYFLFIRTKDELPVYGFYIKNNQLYFTDMSENDPIKLTKRLFESVNRSEMQIDVAQDIAVSSDSKIVFYPDRYSATGFTLYYCNVTDEDQLSLKVDTDVSTYAINEKGNIVTYLNNVEDGVGTLCQHDLNEKTRIAREVSSFIVSADGKKTVYVTADNKLYLNNGKDKEKLSDKAETVHYVTDDFSTVYYTDTANSLYKCGDDGKSVKIAADVQSVIAVYDSGEAYYVTGKSVELIDFVIDDLAESDANAESLKPTPPKRPLITDYHNYDNYSAAYERYRELYSEYLDKYNIYIEMHNRNLLRENIKNTHTDFLKISVCYYDGSKSKALTEDFYSQQGAYQVSADLIAKDSAAMVFTSYNQVRIDQKDIRFIDSAEELLQNLKEELFSGEMVKLATKGTVTEVEMPEITSEKEQEYVLLKMAEDGQNLYYTDNIRTKKGLCDIYFIGITDGNAAPARVYEPNVNRVFVIENDVHYIKDTTGLGGELYINKELIDSYVHYSENDWFYLSDKEITVFRCDYDWQSGTSDLKINNNGRDNKIDREVVDYFLATDGKVLYTLDYDEEERTSEVHLYDGRESREIDDDISELVKVGAKNRRGMFYSHQ